MKYETNIFPIENCHQLTAKYRLFLLIGISETDDEYESHIQYITKKLSYELSHPVTVISKRQDGKRQDYLVIKDDGKTAEKIPVEFDLKRGDSVFFKPTEQVLPLDFSTMDSEIRKICRRFLEFALRGSLSEVQALWSPGSGRPYFSKNTYKSNDGVDIYNGFTPKLVDLPNGGWGIALDVTKKYLASQPLPKYMDRHKFNRIKSKHFIYHFGATWYEVKFSDLSDLDASQHTFVRESDGKRLSVIQDLRERFNGRNMPPDLAGLPDDVTLVVYQNNKGEFRRIPSALCYQILDTEEIGKLHELSISAPFHRRRLIKVARRNYLNNIVFGDTLLVIAPAPTWYSADCIPYPDQEFRNGRILSVKNTPGASQVSIGQIGERRKALLNDSSVGCYVNEPFEPQYFLMPESIATAFGCTVFLEDLKKAVNRMHPSKKGWNPEVLMYDDRNVRNIHGLAIEILAQIQKNIKMGGYAVIMLPKPTSGDHDELAAICVSKCAEMNTTIQVSIMHTDVLKKCIDFQDSQGYVIRKKGLYYGYVKGVALNKVLLNNERWPFILSDALTADLTIGIDVKKNVAGYIFIDKFGKHILPFRQRSKNRERLSEDKVFAAVVKNVKTLGSRAFL